jgi:transposase
MQYKTYLNVKIPRTNCEECGILTLKEMPFGRMGSHYTFFLNE